MALKETSSLRVKASTMFANNSVVGRNTNGGAVWISTAAEARLVGATFENNLLSVQSEYGYGGALHIEASKVRMERCQIDANIARMDHVGDAFGASGGGISIWQDAELTLLDSSFSANQAGGVGKDEIQLPANAETRRIIRASHILSPGITVAQRCVFTTTTPNSLPYSAPWWVVGTAAGRITLVNSTFRGSTIGQAEGMLSLADTASSIVRSCTGSNVLIDPKVAAGKLGVVDSTFAPALGAALKSVAPPMCGTEVAGQRVCDPRAACMLRPSGGVLCQCNGEGIEPPAGLRDDGSRCATIPSLKADVAAPAVRVILLKPGRHPDPLKLQAVATGDEGFNATFSRGTVLRRDGIAVAQSDDGLHARVFGLAFEWVDPQPTSKASMALDAANQQYSAVVEHAFSLALQCAPHATDGPAGNGTTCPQDGDTIETTIKVTPQAGKATPSEVRIAVEVHAAMSCECTQPTVEINASMGLDSLLPSTRFSVHLRALDVDNLAVMFTRAEISVVFGNQAISVQWSRGSNEYVAVVPAELTRQPGRYDLVVNATNSWNDGQAISCELLRRTVIVLPVEKGLDTNVIMAGAGASAVVVVVGSVLLVRKRHAHLQAIMAMLFTEVSPPFDEPHAGMHPSSCQLHYIHASGDKHYEYSVPVLSSVYQ